jgi:23S rRNA (adenine1618-N6)-methyltransferase
VIRTPRGEQSIAFAEADAVQALNRALLASYYGVKEWRIPEGYLCPPIPGRADYIHHLADLLAEDHGGKFPKGEAIRILDIGVGASCIYPIIGRSEYGWSFVASDIDAVALESSARILKANPSLGAGIELVRQSSAQSILKGVIKSGVRFHAVICNPPFHASMEEARAGSARKWRNLGRSPERGLNFGGREAELWCPGGEVGFAERLIQESSEYSEDVAWFTILVSREASLQPIERTLRRTPVSEYRAVDMAQGQKISRFVAWTFLDSRARKAGLK